MDGGLVESGLSVTQQAVAPHHQPPASPSLQSRPRDRRKMPAFLSNLGKPTLRGIRRCPQCGIYNGTRGLSCKNKACGAVFRDGAATGARAGAKKGCTEVVRLVIDGGGGGSEGRAEGTRVFSVRQRGRGAELRGFVELTLTDTAITTPDGTMLTRVSVSLGRCFMAACRQGQGQAQRGGERQPGTRTGLTAQSLQPESPCVHVKQAMECQTEASPLALKSSVLDSLQAPSQVKEELWRLATESTGPLVQRVSRSTLVVKCHANESHPLGLLHLTVASALGGVRAEVRAGERQHTQFHCACQATGTKRGSGVRAGEAQFSDIRGHSEVTGAAPPHPLGICASSASSSSPEVCLHYYACVCALTSDVKLAAEFAHFLSYAPDGVHVSTSCSALAAPDRQHLAESGAPHQNKKFEVEDSLAGIPVWVLSLCPTHPSHMPASASAQGVRESLLAPAPRKHSQRKHPISAAVKDSGSSQPVDESHVSLSFQQWLASVTERIHQTMHFQFDGKPEPLVFHIPQAFFNALQQRLSLGSKKRRLPNFTTAFVRNDALPLGTFSKYTWHITNLLQVKRIFDTPELPLELTQSFVKNGDGSFSPFRCSEVPPAAEGHGGTERPQAIRPLELRTFLKVGTSSSSEHKGPIPFIIEWIPDILPRSRVGELRIRFEYGHQQSGPAEHGDGMAARQVGVSGGAGGGNMVATSDVGQSLPASTIEIFRVTVQ